MRMVSVDRPSALARAVEQLDLEPPIPTLVVAGGAGGIGEAALDRLRPLIDDLAAVAERVGATVVDGGTDAGVAKLLGEARARGRSFALVGVVVSSLAARPGVAPLGEQSAVEPNHSHVLLVPGTSWGDEVPWLAGLAAVLAGDAPSLTALVDGGEITYADAAASVTAGRQVLAFAGSGRTANALAAAVRGESSDEPANALAASGLVHAIDLREDSVEMIERMLAGKAEP
jgi:SLOG in TRPM, prokaryote